MILSWRNVWRNTRRTVLTLLTVVAGCAMMIFMNAIAKGGHDQMILDATNLNMGHIQIHEKGYWENRTIDYAFIPDAGLCKKLSDDKRITGWSSRIHAEGLLSHGDVTSPAIIQGVNPADEKRVAALHLKVRRTGRYLEHHDTNAIVIGEILARNLGVREGDTVSMISQAFDGSIAAEKLKITGLLSSGNQEYDRALVIMTIESADRIFYMNGYRHDIAIRCGSIDDVRPVASAISASIDTNRFEVMDWQGLLPELVQFIVLDDAGAYIFDIILFFVIAFGILNTIQMSVFERTRELGIMLAVGTRPAQIIAMVQVESSMITLLGIILGTLAGAAISFYFQVHPLDYSEYAAEMAVWGVNTIIYPARATWLNYTVTAFSTFVVAQFFTVFPARRAASLRAVDAIRHL